MTVPTAVVTQEEWHARREALLVKEKELTCARDALAAERRRLPMVRVEKDYVFEGPEGEVGLLDLFEGRRQETFQDAPDGVPQDRTGSWVRRSDEYSPDELAGGRA
jgi:predicted dithiol-disulfide oxidoreductase (DUF899 family)